MRDLAIHGDDLIVGTHGRSFWILDDITPLRQLTADFAKSEAHLYRPQSAVRIRWNRNTDTPLPPEVSAGKNPPDGAIIDYYLRSAATEPVTLEIFDAGGKLARRFSSADEPEAIEEKEVNVAMYWVRPTRIPSAEAGLHRFVWDLRYPSPDSLVHDFPIAAIFQDTPREPRGPWALPGRYTVKLTVAGKSYTQPLVVKMDPRVKTTPAGLAQQFELASGITKGMNETFAARKQVQSLRAQLKNLSARAGQGEASTAIAALDKKAEALEGATLETFYGVPPTGKEPETLSRLNQELGELLEVIEGRSDAAPTTQAVALYGAQQRALQALLANWKELGARDVPALNAQLKKAGLPEITLAPAGR